MAIIDLGKLRFDFKGDYDALVAYTALDVVRFNANVYACILDGTGMAPNPIGDNANWRLMVEGTNVLTTGGDMLVHDGTSLGRLAKGAIGEAMVVDSLGHPSWGVPQGRPGATCKALPSHRGGTDTQAFVMTDGTIRVCGMASGYSTTGTTNSHEWAPKLLTVSNAPRPATPFVKVAMGGNSGFALTQGGEVYSWGYNGYGTLGHGNTSNMSVATRIEFFATNNIVITDIIMPSEQYWYYPSVFFLTDAGHVYGCGYNANGQLGDGTTVNKSTPVRCGMLSGITKVSVGITSACPVMAMNATTGELWGWGYNGYGELGLGDTTQRNVPSLVMSTGCADVLVLGGSQTTANYNWTVVLNTSGQLLTCGYNGYGQLGTGNTIQQTTLAVRASNVVQFNAADGHYGTLIYHDTLGNWYGTGYNANGAIGLGDVTNRSSFINIPGLSGVVPSRIFAGGSASSYFGFFILDTTNIVWTTGQNTAGHNGLGHATNQSVWQKVTTFDASMQVIDMVKSGYYSRPVSFALLADGRVLACGANGYGQTGTQFGNVHDVHSFTQVNF